MIKEIIKIISKITKNPEENITLDSSMYDTSGWDSAANLEIICEMESLIERQLTLDEILQASNVKEWVDILQKIKGEMDIK